MNALRIAIASLVAVVWAVVYLASVFNPNISAPAELSGVMLAVVTWLFGAALREGLRDRARGVAQRVLDDTAQEGAENEEEPAVEDEPEPEPKRKPKPKPPRRAPRRGPDD